MTLAMSWDEWAAHDALGLAERVRQGDVSPVSYTHLTLPTIYSV